MKRFRHVCLFEHLLSLYNPKDFGYEQLRAMLQIHRSRGYIGMVVVAKILMDHGLEPEKVAAIFVEEHMLASVCGFLAGGLNPLTESGSIACLAELKNQTAYVYAFCDAGVGKRILHGPIDIGWRLNSTLWNQLGYTKWIAILHGFAIENKLTITIEALNDKESIVPDAFRTLYKAIHDLAVGDADGQETGLFMQWGTVHALMRRMTVNDFVAMAPKIRIFEIEQDGRKPLDENSGVPFVHYFGKAQTLLPASAIWATESFSQEVLDSFDLRGVYSNTVSTNDTAFRNALYFQNRKMITPPAQ